MTHNQRRSLMSMGRPFSPSLPVESAINISGRRQLIFLYPFSSLIILPLSISLAYQPENSITLAYQPELTISLSAE